MKMNSLKLKCLNKATKHQHAIHTSLEGSRCYKILHISKFVWFDKSELRNSDLCILQPLEAFELNRNEQAYYEKNRPTYTYYFNNK